ncbi:protein NDR1-like [Actinidia eriantha]|uniref:protein NDR1-like n=1 Tax=Actinidia eriantha TaxID=165200 RepID=UPI00258DC99F|nr:protein NDR1-like [Actinidia eriantha]
MADSGGGGGCGRCCCSFILTSGLTALFMWLSLRTSNPVCSIQDIYVPALNKSANSTDATNIYFNLKLDNENKDKGIYYDALNLTFFYAPNKSLPIGNRTFPQFHQGHKKNTRRTGWVETRGVPWEAILNGSAASFRVDLATAVRFKIMAWKTKKHKLVVGADVEVNDHGQKVYKKGIRLRSGAPERGCYRARMGTLVTLVIAVYYLVFLN